MAPCDVDQAITIVKMFLMQNPKKSGSCEVADNETCFPKVENLF